MVRLRQNIGVLLIMALCLTAYVTLFLADGISVHYLLANLLSGYLFAWALYGLLSTISREELIQRFNLMTTSIALCLILAEAPAFLRIVDYRAVFGAFEAGNALSVVGRHADRELLWQHDPYFQYEEAYQGNLGGALCAPPDPSQKIVVRYDRNGFRNGVDLQKADIVVIGDSYIEGYMTSESMLATTLLSQLQGKIVANLGHSGYGPQQELVVLKRYGLPLHPHAMIWAFFEGNDLSEAERYEEKVAMAGNPFWRNLWSRSLTRNVLARALHPVRECTPNPEIQQSRAQFKDEHQMVKPVFFSPREPSPFSGSQLSRAIPYIAEAAKLCRERNIRFIVAFVPGPYRVYHDLSNVILSSDAVGSSPVSNLPDEMTRRLARLGLDIEYVDLTLALKTASRKGIATYLADDTHWTDAGNRVVAEALHQTLRSFASQAQ